MVSSPIRARGPLGNPRVLEADDQGHLYITGAVALVGAGGASQTDEITGALVVIDIVHHEAHEGELFSTGYISPHGSLVADNGTIDVVLTTGARYCHAIGQGSFGGDFEGYLYEDADITGGTPIAIRNHKRAGGDATTVTAVHSPTVNNVGTLLDGAFIPGGSRNFDTGATSGQRSEWILKPNSVYLYRLINRAGNAQQGSLGVIWYEEVDN